jgi:hypothetical protein
VEAALSIVPTMSAPAVGEEIAQALTQTRKPISFIEANAISPMTSTAIEQTIIRAGDDILMATSSAAPEMSDVVPCSISPALTLR